MSTLLPLWNAKPISVVSKPWGEEELLEQNSFYMVKRLTMKPGCRCSLQVHKYKKETIIILRGFLNLGIGKPGLDEYFGVTMVPGGVYTIEPGVVHRMSTKEFSTACAYLECSTPYLEDTYRLEDDYARL